METVTNHESEKVIIIRIIVDGAVKIAVISGVCYLGKLAKDAGCFEALTNGITALAKAA